MSHTANQFTFEVARDIASMLLFCKDGDVVLFSFRVHSHGGGEVLCDVTCSEQFPCGPSEVAQAMKKAYVDSFKKLSDSR